MKTKRTIGLMAFLRGSTNPEDRVPGCCNYNLNSGGCLCGDKCKVEQGKRCEYFEKAVLPTAADIGLKELVYKLYGKQVGIDKEVLKIPQKEDARLCPDCGAALKPRHRYCDKCTIKRRRESYRTKRRNIKTYAPQLIVRHPHKVEPNPCLEAL
jgi:hypothetical protein